MFSCVVYTLLFSHSFARSRPPVVFFCVANAYKWSILNLFSLLLSFFIHRWKLFDQQTKTCTLSFFLFVVLIIRTAFFLLLCFVLFCFAGEIFHVIYRILIYFHVIHSSMDVLESIDGREDKYKSKHTQTYVSLELLFFFKFCVAFNDTTQSHRMRNRECNEN